MANTVQNPEGPAEDRQSLARWQRVKASVASTIGTTIE